MKSLLSVIPIALLLSSCACKPSQRAQRIVTVRPGSSGQVLKREETAAVRHPEVVKAYPVGRYVEPRRRSVMHEAHTLYRVEQSPQWNLTRPQGAVTTATLPPPRVASPSGNELTVELNRQRQATQAVMQGGQIVTEKLSEMTAALERNRVLAEQNAAIQEELRTSHLRLETLEREMRSRPADTTTPPGPTLDDAPW